MGSKRRSVSKSTQLDRLTALPEINVTPLVDVVLVLLIIFMVVAPSLSEGAQIELPKVTSPDAKAKDSRPIDVAMAEDGSILVDGNLITAQQLRPTLERLHAETPERSLLLKSDEKAKYKKMRDTFAMAQDVGFKGILLKVVQKQTGPAGS